MSKKLFGTDGIRGVANQKLTPELALQIGQAAGRWVVEQGLPPRVVMGRDTRQSGTMLGAALAAGFNSAGVEAHSLGVCPTGGISWITRTQGYSLGAVISASHNPAPDNGIKLIAAGGGKAPDELEAYVEANLLTPFERPTGGSVGVIDQPRDGIAAYMDWLETLVPERLEGLKVAIDAAHGAAFELGIQIFERLGAEVHATGNTPDGVNINEEGGATKPHVIQDFTRSVEADLGIAYDGDADRAVFSDSEGRLVNGDRTMAIWCAHWRRHGGLDPALVVGTVMSNGGFASYMEAEGIALHRADVGDKYVSRMLAQLGGKIGGEQSGHIIFPEIGPTGDGLVTALQLARVLVREKAPLASFYGAFEYWPQLLVNVEVATKDGLNSDPGLLAAIEAAQEELGSRGRINVRPSGTQPMVRVMVEADDADLRDQVSEKVVAAMLAALGGRIYSRVDLTHALGD